MNARRTNTPRRLHFGQGARQKIVDGALKAALAVVATYGPRGGIVALERVQGLIHTKDGATVAREISLPDRVENLGAQLVRQACLSVNDTAGDGTTTTAILTYSLLSQIHEALAAEANPVQLRDEVLEAVQVAVQVVQDQAAPVDKSLLRYVAQVASNQDDEIAEAMTEAAMAVGKDGTIMIADGHKVGIELEFKDGMQIDSGWAHHEFVTDYERQECHKEEVLVAVVAVPLMTPADVASIMEEASTFRENDKALPDPLLILAPKVGGDALITLVMNNQRYLVDSRTPGSQVRKLPVYMAVNAPGVGPRKADFLGDIAAAAGAPLVDPVAGMDHKQFNREWFGSFQNISLYRDRSVFTVYEQHEDSISQRLRVLRVQEKLCTSDFDRDQLKMRKARLSGGVCMFKISSHSEAALKERRARVEDTLASIQAALRSGVVPGGGTALLNAASVLGDSQGAAIVKRALQAPLRRLAYPDTTVPQVQAARLGDWDGLDVTKGQVRDLRQHPAIIDPTDVVVEALRAAASVATTFLTTEVTMTRVKK